MVITTSVRWGEIPIMEKVNTSQKSQDKPANVIGWTGRRMAKEIFTTRKEINIMDK